MVIKAGKTITWLMVITGILMYAACLVLCMVYPEAWIVILGLMIVLFALYIPSLIAFTRTIVMDETGCTVRWLWFEKTFRWDELQLRQYVEYGVALGMFRRPAHRGAEFYHKNVKIPRGLHAQAFSAFFHPYQFVFVQFTTSAYYKTALKDTSYTPYAYAMDEEEFRARLQEWGVEMNQVSRGLDV